MLDCLSKKKFVKMSGSGRKSHYRKNITEKFLNSMPVPEEGEDIVKVHGSRGTNIFEVMIIYLYVRTTYSY